MESCHVQLIDLIGIHGYVTLRETLQHIPAGFLSYRNQYVANILSVCMKKDVSVADVKQYLSWLHDSETYSFNDSPPIDLLWQVTFRFQYPHTLFLAPPVTDCLLCMAPLQTHHSPSVVTCYTLQGPLPAAKITLRCRNCGTNYRYAIFTNV